MGGLEYGQKGEIRPLLIGGSRYIDEPLDGIRNWTPAIDLIRVSHLPLWLVDQKVPPVELPLARPRGNDPMYTYLSVHSIPGSTSWWRGANESLVL